MIGFLNKDRRNRRMQVCVTMRSNKRLQRIQSSCPMSLQVIKVGYFDKKSSITHHSGRHQHLQNKKNVVIMYEILFIWLESTTVSVISVFRIHWSMCNVNGQSWGETKTDSCTTIRLLSTLRIWSGSYSQRVATCNPRILQVIKMKRYRFGNID